MTGPLDRLGVDLERPTPGLVNKITNPTGAGGSVVGWLTPVAGSTLTATATTGGTNDHGIAGDKLIYTAITGANYFYSLPFLVTPGQYIGARWKARYVEGTNYYTQRIEFLQADKTTWVNQTRRTAARTASAVFSVAGPQLIPAGAVYARIRFDFYSLGGGNPFAGDDLIFQDVQVVTASTAAAMGTRRFNIITNGGAEDSTAATPAVSACTVSRQTATPRYETAYWRLQASSAAASCYIQSALPAALAAVPSGGGTVVAAASVRPVGATARNFRFELTVSNGSITSVLTSSTFTEVVGSYVDASYVFTIASNIVSLVSARVVMLGAPTLVVGEQHCVDGWQFMWGETTPGVIFHHATPDVDNFTYEFDYNSDASYSSPGGALEHAFTGTVAASPTFWEDVTGSHAEVKIVRRPLDAGTLATVLKPDQLPSGLDPEMVPGAGYRVRLDTDPLITSVITSRAPRDSTRVIPPITVAGADTARVLVSTPKADGVADLADLAWILEDIGVPWLINGSSAAVATPTPIATHANAKAIDQIAMTRDYRHAYAWVSREGVIVVNDAAHLDLTEHALIDEDDYSYIEQGYDVDSCINLVTVKGISTSAGVTTVTTYGPFNDPVSIDKWGEHPATLTLLNITSSLTAQAYAEILMTANGDPPYQVVAVTIPIKRDAQDPIALLDLYDLARVQHADTSTDQVLHVTEIVHEITPRKWLMKLRFTTPGIAALPQVIPDP